jgi:hypothetical protein
MNFKTALLVALLGTSLACKRQRSPLEQAGLAPTTFAPGIVSTDAEEYRITFTPDGQTAGCVVVGAASRHRPVHLARWATSFLLVHPSR